MLSDLIRPQPKQASSRFIESLGLGERRPTVTIEVGDAPGLVRKELARQKTDLLVLGADERFGVQRALTGAVEAILRASPCDVLLLPDVLAQAGRPSPAFTEAAFVHGDPAAERVSELS